MFRYNPSFVGEEKEFESPSISFLGAGEWPEKQLSGLEKAAETYNIDFSLSSVQDIRPEDDIDWLQDVETEYFRDEDITNQPQDGFLEDTDLVYVANRIDQHPEQIDNIIEEIDEKGLSTSIAVEKALSPRRDEHVELMNKADDYGIEIGMIDHYAFKPQARKLEAFLPDQVRENGRVTEANFIAREESDPNDYNRKWVFEKEVGGIGLDWLPHLYSVMIGRLGARFEDEDFEGLEAEPANYDPDFLDDTPTAVKVSSPVSGQYFADDAVVKGEVGKRYDEKEKKIKLEYENGETLEWELTDNVEGPSSNTYAALRLLDMAREDVPNEKRDDPALDGMKMVYNALDQVNGRSKVEAAYMD